MGPAAWAAVGRAMSMALAASLLSGHNNVVAVIATQIKTAIINNDLETAANMLRDLAWRHSESFEAFLKKYGDELPPETLDEITSFLKKTNRNN